LYNTSPAFSVFIQPQALYCIILEVKQHGNMRYFLWGKEVWQFFGFAVALALFFWESKMGRGFVNQDFVHRFSRHFCREMVNM